MSNDSQPKGWMRQSVLPGLGLAATGFLWWFSIQFLGHDSILLQRFSPDQTLVAAEDLIKNGELWTHTLASLKRVALGLFFAVLIGVPLGLLIGIFPIFNRISSTSFQFLRMISPLAWMPIAVIALGVGEAPVIFLVSFAAVWPIIINVSAGVAAIDPQWLKLANSVGANGIERLAHIVIPAIAAHLLTGIRIAIGLIWVVLVPAEMLGINAGLGYLILDTRDRMAYGELMAAILFIGCLGFSLDWVARLAHRKFADH